MTTQMTAPAEATADPWRGFTTGPWAEGIDVRDFIQRNYTPYTGDASFLSGPTEKTPRAEREGDLDPGHEKHQRRRHRRNGVERAFVVIGMHGPACSS